MLTSQSGNIPIRPTSLDFINRPNPVEPDKEPGKHPLNGTLEQTPKDEFLRLLLDKDVERPTKRRKSGDPKSLDLPKLPVRNGTKRLRIPPTLSGLHQPPPDAGLLPSMSVEQPLRLSDGPVTGQTMAVEAQKPAEESLSTSTPAKPLEPSETKSSASVVKRKHNKWTERETACLLKGVARFGIGQWTKILNCPDYSFEDRTALDLKDRFRVCCPEEYKTTAAGKKIKDKTDSKSEESAAKTSEQKVRSRTKKSDCVSSTQLRELGIDKPFEKSKRRGRTGYSVEEDEALLKGFKKHGNAWASIRNDNEILADRTATDLRDRFRTKYPDEYAKAGLAPRPEQFPKKGGKQGEKSDGDGKRHNTDPKIQSISAAQAPTQTQHEKENKVPTTSVARKPPATSLLQMDDVFWSAPFEPVDADSEQPTLDRSILAWAYDIARPPATNDSTAKAAGIDPLATLNLPRPTVTSSSNAATGNAAAVPQTSASGTSANAANALPSLASITAPHSWPNGMEAFNEEALELPSLMGAFGALETDARAGGHFMSMDELLS